MACVRASMPGVCDTPVTPRAAFAQTNTHTPAVAHAITRAIATTFAAFASTCILFWQTDASYFSTAAHAILQPSGRTVSGSRWPGCQWDMCSFVLESPFFEGITDSSCLNFCTYIHRLRSKARARKRLRTSNQRPSTSRHR